MHIVHNVVKQPCASLPRGVEECLPHDVLGYIGNHFDARKIEEIRLRADRYSSCVIGGENLTVPIVLDKSSISQALKAMCGGSLYAFSDTINKGYISLPNGIRVGVAGKANTEEGRIIGIYEVSSLCIRIPHRILSVGREICELLSRLEFRKGVLIYSPPGVGKTTVLRGVCKMLSSGSSPKRVVVIDSRGELSFDLDSRDMCLDILSGYPRGVGIEIATRVLNPQLIVCDEIGDTEESLELVAANNSGIPLLATAHAGDIEELLSRTGIRLLHEAGVFGAYVRIKRSANMSFSYDISLRGDIVGGIMYGL